MPPMKQQCREDAIVRFLRGELTLLIAANIFCENLDKGPWPTSAIGRKTLFKISARRHVEKMFRKDQPGRR